MAYHDSLTELAKRIEPKRILEIGIGYEALSTQAWLNHTKAHVTCIDREDAMKMSWKLTNEWPTRFSYMHGASAEVVPHLTRQFDFIYIDGEHRYDGVWADIANCKPLTKVGGLMMIDDYGVEISGVHDYETGAIVDAPYGVKDATDELLFADPDWEQVFTDIDFANGGVCFRRIK